ncbi:MAG: AlkZ family DNA glycosylase, partial [Cytophagales bacterium]|nr:AlkZ family DNA glycosylase [Cytophagales bacterium]
MKATQIAALRLVNQHLTGTRLQSTRELVQWMGAVQAQDYSMSKWALGIRLPHITHETVQSAFDRGEILRTHILRPTWHLVAADDIHWLLALTAPHVRSLLTSGLRELALTEKTVADSQRVMASALAGGRHLTRPELVGELRQANLPADPSRSVLLLMRAELDGVVCSGRVKGKEQTYALLAERVPPTEALPREEALARLARRYFTSHGPATAQDFAWWSGLPAADVRKGVAGLGPAFISHPVDGQTYWRPRALPEPGAVGETVFLLPAFDEFLISYKDRSASLAAGSQAAVITSNGIFRPVVLVNGQVAGTWKRTVNKGTIRVQTELFGP